MQSERRSCLHLCSIVLLGLFYISIQCDARAVNVSNTWTMPQEGLNVFYRFFRDRISWFEADAVCQFHHANLVTVDNSFQFDATRDLLRELDVNDIVWIGLMRPQSSDRFMWSNSRPLVANTGYWAESLPLMDAPLCAVIDPIRDYRWHALRCGGPETASFLCEMPVPAWADACILKDMPNLTMQYMADTASIELIRNCEEEGLLRQTCKGKQDRDRAMRELICPRERLEAQRINDITNSHFKSLQIINSIPSDNNENNNIELLPHIPMDISAAGYDFGNADIPSEQNQVQTEKNTVQRLIEQFNVDELMQADEALAAANANSYNNQKFIIPGQIPKPVKKSAKKVVLVGDYGKKEALKSKKEAPMKYDDEYVAEASNKQAKQQKRLEALEDMMMGDQPQGELETAEDAVLLIKEDVSNEIFQPLPHQKKVQPQDLKTKPPPNDKKKEDKLLEKDDGKLKNKKKFAVEAKLAEKKKQELAEQELSAATTVKSMSTESAASSTAEQQHKHEEVQQQPAEQHELTTTLQQLATIGHPMHPQQPRSNVITEEAQHTHIKEAVDNSHFIPPMLLVKSHYVPPSKHEHHEHHNHDSKPLNALEADKPQEISTEGAVHVSSVGTTAATVAAEAETLKPLTGQTATLSAIIESSKDQQHLLQPALSVPKDAKDAKKSIAKEKPTKVAKDTDALITTTVESIGSSSTSSAAPAEQATKIIINTTPELTATTTTIYATTTSGKPAENTELPSSNMLLTTTTTTAAAATTITTAAAAETATEDLTTNPPAIKPESLPEVNAESKPTTAAAINIGDSSTPLPAAATTTALVDSSSSTATTEIVDNTKPTQQQPEVEEKSENFGKAETLKEIVENVASATTTTSTTTTTTTAATTTTTTTTTTMPTTTSAASSSHSSSSATTESAEIFSSSTAAAELLNADSFSTTIAASSSLSPSDSASVYYSTSSPYTTFYSSAATTLHSSALPSLSTTESPLIVASSSDGSSSSSISTTTSEPAVTHNFLQEQTEEQLFKPNRRRSLTKPETMSYFKKILG